MTRGSSLQRERRREEESRARWEGRKAVGTMGVEAVVDKRSECQGHLSTRRLWGWGLKEGRTLMTYRSMIGCDTEGVQQRIQTDGYEGNLNQGLRFPASQTINKVKCDGCELDTRRIYHPRRPRRTFCCACIWR